jgi:hypothetical protein
LDKYFSGSGELADESFSAEEGGFKAPYSFDALSGSKFYCSSLKFVQSEEEDGAGEYAYHSREVEVNGTLVRLERLVQYLVEGAGGDAD